MWCPPEGCQSFDSSVNGEWLDLKRAKPSWRHFRNTAESQKVFGYHWPFQAPSKLFDATLDPSRCYWPLIFDYYNYQRDLEGFARVIAELDYALPGSPEVEIQPGVHVPSTRLADRLEKDTNYVLGEGSRLPFESWWGSNRSDGVTKILFFITNCYKIYLRSKQAVLT